MTGARLPEAAYAAALAALPGMGPKRLSAALGAGQTAPSEAWDAARRGCLAAGAPADVDASPRPTGSRSRLPAIWRHHARSVDVAEGWAAITAAGVGVHVAGHDGYPEALAGDHEAPAVVFSRGDVAAIGGRRVAIVGSRDCTRYGREVAFGLGRDLAAARVAVVSGLALGVDGAAHAGALKASGAPPVAVVGSGLDVVYPRRNAGLWREVAAAGVILSEAPLGAAPEPWRFPVRNRIIAALAELVVVVESRHTGGSRHTVDAASNRDRPVLAVPGPVRSPASELPNALLAEGCHPARDAVDVLVALQLATPLSGRAAAPAVVDPRPPPEAEGRAVLDALGWQPATFEQVVVATGRSPGAVGVALAHLERDGWVAGDGGWWERRAAGVPTG